MKAFVANAFHDVRRHTAPHPQTLLPFGADGDTAHGRAPATTRWFSTATTQPKMMFVGLWYVDTFVRTPDGWRFKKKRVEPRSKLMHAPPFRKVAHQ